MRKTKKKKKLLTTLEKAATFVNNNTQIIPSLFTYNTYNDDPQLFSYAAMYPGNALRTEKYEYGSGFSFDKHIALIRAIGEGIERYCLDKYKSEIITKSSIKNINFNFLNPINVSPFSLTQLAKTSFDRFRISENSIFQWTKGKSLFTGKEILLPAQLVSFSYEYLPEEPVIFPQLSTGVAAGETFEDALYRAICEVIERDSYMISYLNKLPSPKINLQSLKNKQIKQIQSTFERYNLELVILDLTSDLTIPSVAAITIDRTGLGPAISIGLKSGFEQNDIILGAIEESLMTRSWLRDKFVYSNEKYKTNQEIKTIDDRAHYWFKTDMINQLNFWLKQNNFIQNTLEKETIKDPLQKVLELLKKHNLETFYVDISENIIKTAGFRVVRVIIPKLCPLYLDERFPSLGIERLYDVPVKMHLLKQKSTEEMLNKVPHPFL